MNGVVTASSLDTGKVIDVHCMSKYCFICKGQDILNHEGVNEIYKRSNTPSNPAQYTNFLGDGDSKSFEVIKGKKPYGHAVVIKKMECIGHIQKRMGSRLRRLSQKHKGTVLADGKKLSGEGRLTDNVINDLQNYYGVAISSNCDSVDKMWTAVWATFIHKKSKHGLCPEGSASWCKHNRAKAMNIDPPNMSKGTLPDSVLDAIKPVYNDLAKGSLLEKCLHGMTQDHNEFSIIVSIRS